jgi:TolB-like protein
MNPKRFITATVCILMCGKLFAQTATMDTELAALTEKLAAQIKDHGKKKVAVIDFTDLQGGSSELGRYIAEELTVNFVTGKREFSVLDRANLKSILAEHKLTATGLVDPENAKKLGMFAGVDAIILGNIVPLNQNIELTAKVITTDTAEIIGAARSRFKADETVQQLLSRATTEATGGNSDAPKKEEPKVVKSFGDLRVELPPLRIVNGTQFLLTIVFTNTNPKKSVWVAVSTDMGSNVKGVVTDSNGAEFRSDWNYISGMAFTPLQNGGFFKATEVPPHDSISANIKFVSRSGRATPGDCRVQLELLVGHDFNGTFGDATVRNLTSELKAN